MKGPELQVSDDLQRLRPLLLAVLAARRHLGAACATVRSRSFREGLTSLERQNVRLAAELALTMLSLGAAPEAVSDEPGAAAELDWRGPSDVAVATSVLLLERRVLAAYERALADPTSQKVRSLLRRHLAHVADACEELEAFRRVLEGRPGLHGFHEHRAAPSETR